MDDLEGMSLLTGEAILIGVLGDTGQAALPPAPLNCAPFARIITTEVVLTASYPLKVRYWLCEAPVFISMNS